MKYQVNINGIDVEADFDDKAVDEIFRPLLHKLSGIRKAKSKRVLVMLVAPPGTGKSTLVSFLEFLSKETIPEYKVQAIGMDGFHRRQEYLKSHTMMVDGKEVVMVDVKGCPETFDLDKLAAQIEKVMRQGTCTWPTYDRHLHNPVENAITIDSDIEILEGNYLLLNKPGWNGLSEAADFTIAIKADEDMLRERLIDRKQKSGNTWEESEQFVDYSDMRNVRLCLEHTKKADMELMVKRDGNYVMIM